MIALSVRPRTPEDDKRIVEMRNKLNPEFPPLTVERFRHWIEVSAKDERNHEERFVAEDGVEVAGYMALEKQHWLKNPDVFWADILVDRPSRGHGIGSRLWETLLERLSALGARRLYGYVREDQPTGQQFVSRRGFTRTGHKDRASRLDVRAANLEGYDGLVERLEAEGILIRSLAQLGTEESFLRELHAMEWRAVQDIPSNEEIGDEPMPFDLWREEMLHGPERSPHAFFLAIDQRTPVGLARLGLRGASAAYNGFTGVDPAYRGRGIARALKLKTVEWARDNGLQYIYTDNDTDNKRMLAINIRMGYRPLPSFEEWMKELQA